MASSSAREYWQEGLFSVLRSRAMGGLAILRVATPAVGWNAKEASAAGAAIEAFVGKNARLSTFLVAWRAMVRVAIAAVLMIRCCVLISRGRKKDRKRFWEGTRYVSWILWAICVWLQWLSDILLDFRRTTVSKSRSRWHGVAKTGRGGKFAS